MRRVIGGLVSGLVLGYFWLVRHDLCLCHLGASRVCGWLDALAWRALDWLDPLPPEEDD